jgi:ankyrin repeat protein
MKRIQCTMCLLLLTLAIGISTLGASGHWSGDVTREIAVRVISAESGQPIARGLVRLSSLNPPDNPYGTDGQPVIEAITDDLGWATLKVVFHGSGTSGLGGGWWMRGWLEVEQVAYEKAENWLVNFAGIEDVVRRVGRSKPDLEASRPMTLERIEILVEMKRKGADINLQDATALLRAAWSSKDPERISALVKAGTDVNARDKDGWTALMYATRYNQRVEVISVLLDSGADVNAQDKDGRTALWWAVHPAIVASPEVISLLLRAGAEVNLRDQNGQTPLWWAAGCQDSAVVSLLLKSGSDANVRGMPYGQTPLMKSVEGNANPEVVPLLLQHGADVNAGDYAGRTALIYCAGSCDPALLSLLLNAGANVNARDKEGGETALMRAAKYSKNPEVVSLLLDWGADAKVKSRERRTAFDYVKENSALKDTEAYNKLLEAQY